MIICSKTEANGATREFLIDDTIGGREVPVRTHLHAGAEAAGEAWSDAGLIIRSTDGLLASVTDGAAFVRLEQRFTNEIAALQAIAVSYQPN